MVLATTTLAALASMLLVAQAGLTFSPPVLVYEGSPLSPRHLEEDHAWFARLFATSSPSPAAAAGVIVSVQLVGDGAGCRHPTGQLACARHLHTGDGGRSFAPLSASSVEALLAVGGPRFSFANGSFLCLGLPATRGPAAANCSGGTVADGGSGGLRLVDGPRDVTISKVPEGTGFMTWGGSTVRAPDGSLVAIIWANSPPCVHNDCAATHGNTIMHVGSEDGFSWSVRHVLPPFVNASMPCARAPSTECRVVLNRKSESDTVVLPSGTLLTVFRVASGSPYFTMASSDSGHSFSEPTALGAWSVFPRLLQMPSGALLLSGGRPGLSLWLSHDSAVTWTRRNLAAIHNSLVHNQSLRFSTELADVSNATGGMNWSRSDQETTGYTSMVALGPAEVLLSYDRLADGWAGPRGDGHRDRVFTMRFSIGKTDDESSPPPPPQPPLSCVPWSLAVADAMVTMSQDWAPYRPAASSSLSGEVDMAQNEAESVQIVVVAGNQADVTNVTWKVSSPGHHMLNSSTAAELSFEVAPFGFVRQGPCSFEATAKDNGCPASQPWLCAKGMRDRCIGPKCNITTGEGTCKGASLMYNRTTGIGCASNNHCCIGCSYLGSPIFDGGERAQRYCPGKFDDPKLWIAYPLLDWVTKVPTIRQGTAQPLLLTVRSKVSTPPGIYTVELTVTSGSGHTQAVPVIVRVRPIVIPQANTLKTLWGDEERSPNMTEFLLAHRLPAGSTIYGGERGTLWPSYADSVSRLAALWKSGHQSKIIVCDWSQCAGQANGQGAECVANREAQLRNATALLDRAGWPRDARYLYLTDEMLQGWAQSHDIINDPSGLFQDALSEEARQLELIVSIAPELEIVATGFPRVAAVWQAAMRNLSEVLPGGRLQHISTFAPWCSQISTQNATATEGIARLRKAGKGVGCYTADSVGDFGMDFAPEYPGIRTRLLMGAGMWQQKVDLFLYYSITEWHEYDYFATKGFPYGPIELDESLRYLSLINGQDVTDGEGQLAVPGPPNSKWSGVLTTQQLLQVRDGLEDYELYVLMDKLQSKARARGVALTPAEATATVVPPMVMNGFPTPDTWLGAVPSRREYTEDVYVVRQQWKQLADAIESLQARLGNHTLV